jgi:hypothetical protein
MGHKEGTSWSREPDWNLETGKKWLQKNPNTGTTIHSAARREVHEETEARHMVHRKKSQTWLVRTACKREFLGPLLFQPKTETGSRPPNKEIETKS